MKSLAEQRGQDIEYLRRCKAATPAQRLAWLEAAWEFAYMAKKGDIPHTKNFSQKK